jgi:hypothetical protein
MSGITYFCTDQHGNVYQRYSAGHIQPRYFFAVVSRGLGTTLPVGKANVAYTSRRDLANKALTQCHNWRGQWEAEVVQVRSYRGRLKEEPVGALGLAATASFFHGCVAVPAERQEVVDDYYEGEKADTQQGRGE